ncbi:MAG: DUF4411 family protein [Sphingopyxis sp.]|uniref:DUF4411 family protein n=1 Tax=Sphingopyxis sp. TaxID=1908224 RepID=UPI001A3A1EFF|nr:DUF4411 family protein [Sphingopyxis sp.]MBL9065008.1 DUF4411 family protein [Sphingopyxis sp.]
MLYLLDADTVITADRDQYPLRRFGLFWDWLHYQAQRDVVKIPWEQFDEVVSGKGEIVDWLNDGEIKKALVLDEEPRADIVSRVVVQAYGDLNDVELELVGRDPFLIGYACADLGNRSVVTYEKSAPGQKRGKRKVPDACNIVGVPSLNLFKLIDALDFTTDWRRP